MRSRLRVRRLSEMKQIALVLFLIGRLAGESSAQTTRSTLSADRMLDTAMRLANGGQVSEARTIIDSLFRTISNDSPRLADALFARATLATGVLDASLDYERIIREFPSSRRREQSLLRAAQRSFAAGDNAKALEYLGTMNRDYRADSSQATADYWMARVLLEQHEIAAACAASGEAASHAAAAGTALMADIAAESAGSCAPDVASASGDSISPASTRTRQAVVLSVGAPARKTYAVQVSAYDTKSDAEAMSRRLKKEGLDAHVDGTTKPFRVRIGHYSTYPDAAAALRELKARNLAGFVAEMKP